MAGEQRWGALCPAVACDAGSDPKAPERWEKRIKLLPDQLAVQLAVLLGRGLESAASVY